MNKLTKAHASPKDDNTHTRSVAAIPKDHPPSGKDNNNNALEARQVSTQESKKLLQTFSRRTHAGNWHELCRPQKARDTIAQQQTEALPLNTGPIPGRRGILPKTTCKETVNPGLVPLRASQADSVEFFRGAHGWKLGLSDRHCPVLD